MELRQSDILSLPPVSRAHYNLNLLREAVARAEAVIRWAELMGSGLSPAEAASQIGINITTLYRWGTFIGQADPGAIIDGRWRSGRKRRGKPTSSAPLGGSKE